ncbi:hypothetical protein LUZ63_010094 [Rhynchospora breviuscula]|uniref:LOB domain-containing protein n=1 Tax=Rhynchospora breviuscula TaxID=2022672 RepID=A0A9Q0CG95_9POAL|nr:hypothetical protein LUZ63_010094 [Rhynchospora breviuscula]
MAGFGSPCGACKFLRRKCVRGCVFAPYFCHEQGAAHFAAIHKVFGASNVSKLLMHLPVADRPEAAVTISYEAQARLQDPIYGCVSHIFALQQQVMSLQAQVATLKAQQAQEQENFPIPNQTINGGSASSTIHSPPFNVDDLNSSYNNLLLDSNFMQQLNHSSAAVDVPTCIGEELAYRDGMEELQSVAYGYFRGQ